MIIPLDAVGHNEADEPAFTQPRMYKLIDEHPPVRALYTQQLVQRGDITADDEQAVEYDFKARLDRAFEETHAGRIDRRRRCRRAGLSSDDDDLPPVDDPVATAVPAATLVQVVEGLDHAPEGFEVNPKLERQLPPGARCSSKDEIDWPLAEALAFGSLVLEGTPVRLAGQDTRRARSASATACSSTRHASRSTCRSRTSPTTRRRSCSTTPSCPSTPRSGSSTATRSAPTRWCAGKRSSATSPTARRSSSTSSSSAAADKWGQRSSLAHAAPPRLRGPGPRALQRPHRALPHAVAEDNLRVVYPTTAAQYFHVLRRQAVARARVPLVCFTPKRYLRMPQTRSPLAAFTDGALLARARRPRRSPRHREPRASCAPARSPTSSWTSATRAGAPAAVVRVEQLYPWPEAQLFAVLDRYPDAKQVWWVQEEPANMGAWNYIHIRLHRVLRDRAKLKHVARAPSASPASGSSKVHDAEQRSLLAAAFAKL